MALEKVRTLLGLGRRAAGSAIADIGLRAVIDEVASAWPFTAPAIDVSPAGAGVYFLYRDGRLVYIGLALPGAGIRQSLAKHHSGAWGACTRATTAFTYELAEDPRPLYERCLELHRERYGGRLPSCQQALG